MARASLAYHMPAGNSDRFMGPDLEHAKKVPES
jgi:hypothetical protein